MVAAGWVEDHACTSTTHTHHTLPRFHHSSINGWDLYAQRVQLNGQSIVAGWPTPMDPTLPPNCPCTYVYTRVVHNM